MSSIFRVVKFQNYINKTRNLLINTNVLERNSILYTKLPLHLSSNRIFERRISAQHQPKDDLLQSQRRIIEQNFQFVDSIIKRGTFLRRNTFETLLNVVTQSKDITPSQALFVLNCCGSSLLLENKAVRRKLSNQVYEILKTKEFTWDVSHYNSLLQNFVENDVDFSPSDFLAMLEQKNVAPNRVTYIKLIAKFCQKGDIESANKILEHMKNEGMEISESIFCSLIIGNARAKDLEGAVSVLEIMKQCDIKLGYATYAALIQAHCENNKVDEIERILSEGLKEGSLRNSSLLEIVSHLAEDLDQSFLNKIIALFDEKEGSPSSLIKLTLTRLLSSGYDELAYKVYKYHPREEEQCFIGTYFPKMLPVSNVGFHKVVSYCEDLRNSGWNIISYELALESYLHQGDFKSAMDLMLVMRDKGITLKEHYFYPILAKCAKGRNTKRIFEILEDILKFEVHLSVDFYSSFFLPLFDNSNIDKIHSNFRQLISYPEVKINYLFNGYIEYLLRSSDIDKAAQFVTRNPRNIMPSTARLLSDVYLKTLNSGAAAQLLYYMIPFEVRHQKEFVEGDLETKYAGIESFFRRIFYESRSSSINDTHIHSLLKAMLSEEVFLPPSFKEFLINNLGESVNSDIEETIEKLTDESAVFSLKEKSFRPSLLHEIEESEAGGQINEDLNIRLLYSLLRKNKLEEAEGVVKKLKSNNIAIPPNVQVTIISLYIETNQFEKAEALYNEKLETHPEFEMKPLRVLKLARMFCDMGRVEDAIKCILINSPENGKWSDDFKWEINQNNFLFRGYITSILNALVEKSDLSTLKRMQEALLSRNFASPSVIMPSLVGYHIQQNNLEEAFSSYKNIAKEYGVTAGKSELTIACIKDEDTERLQQILEISNNIHGEYNTLYDLVFAFLEVGKVIQAERVLQTSGLRIINDKLYNQCKYYVAANKIEQLKNLISISKNVFGINRNKMFGFLLDAYIASDDPDKCLGIWTSMQEENLIPDDKFLIKLGEYLHTKGCDVPFEIPTQNFNEEIENKSLKDEIWEAVRRGNIRKLNHLVEENKSVCVDFNPRFVSEIIETFMADGNMFKVIELTNMMLMQNKYPLPRVLRKILSKLSEDGKNVAVVQNFGKYMDENLRMLVRYNSYLGISMVEAGKAKELIENTFKIAAEQEPDSLNEDIILTRASCLKVLEKHPELYQDVTNLIEKLKNSNIPHMQTKSLSLIESLYSYNFVAGNHDEADKIYEENFKDMGSFDIRFITSHCYHKSNTEILEKLMEVIDRNPEDREKMKGFLLSTHIDILSNEKKFEEALDVIKKSLESIKLEDYRRLSLFNLQKKMSSESLTFPFEIPPKKVYKESSDSSSDSDDVQ